MARRHLIDIDIDQERMQRLVRALRAQPERLDKLMRREFRVVAKEVEADVRPKIAAWHPRLKPRNNRPPASPNAAATKRRGTYRWKQMVNSAAAGSDSDTPYIKYGIDRLPGAPGWEFGSSREPNRFGPRTARQGRGNIGHVFFPSVFAKVRTLDRRMEAIVWKYEAIAFG